MGAASVSVSASQPLETQASRDEAPPMSPGMIGGIAIGATVLIIAIAAAIFFRKTRGFARSKRFANTRNTSKKRDSAASPEVIVLKPGSSRHYDDAMRAAGTTTLLPSGLTVSTHPSPLRSNPVERPERIHPSPLRSNPVQPHELATVSAPDITSRPDPPDLRPPRLPPLHRLSPRRPLVKSGSLPTIRETSYGSIATRVPSADTPYTPSNYAIEPPGSVVPRGYPPPPSMRQEYSAATFNTASTDRISRTPYTPSRQPPIHPAGNPRPRGLTESALRSSTAAVAYTPSIYYQDDPDSIVQPRTRQRPPPSLRQEYSGASWVTESMSSLPSSPGTRRGFVRTEDGHFLAPWGHLSVEDLIEAQAMNRRPNVYR